MCRKKWGSLNSLFELQVPEAIVKDVSKNLLSMAMVTFDAILLTETFS